MSDSRRIFQVNAGSTELSPFHECYANSATVLRSAAGRLFVHDNGEDPGKAYWALRREAAALAQSTPEEFRLGCWACQDMLTVDVAPRRGPRSENGELFVPNEPGLGFAPDEALLGDPVAVYGGQSDG